MNQSIIGFAFFVQRYVSIFTGKDFPCRISIESIGKKYKRKKPKANQIAALMFLFVRRTSVVYRKADGLSNAKRATVADRFLSFVICHSRVQQVSLNICLSQIFVGYVKSFELHRIDSCCFITKSIVF